MTNLKNGVGPNGYKLKAGVTVFDDLAADVMKGQSGQDGFFATLNGAPGTNDIVSDQLLNEILN